MQNNVSIIPGGLNNPLLNAYGSSGIFNDVANIGSINPAALASIYLPSIGLSYQFDSKLNPAWIYGISSKRVLKALPHSVGFVYPLDYLRLGFAIHQKYNSELLIGPIELTSNELPDGTGEFLEPEYRTKVFTYSLMASYTFPVNSNKSLSTVGIRLNLNSLHEYERLKDTELDASAFATSFTVGAAYRSGKNEDDYFKLGVYYESTLEFLGTGEYTDRGKSLIYIDTGGSEGQYQIVSPLVNISANFPPKLQFDLDYSKIPNFKILASVSNVFWNSISGNSKNQIDFSGSVVYSLNAMFTPTLGFIYSNRQYARDGYGLNDNLNALYITAGLVIKYYSYNINLVFADSHLFSGDWRKQTIFKSSVSYGF